MQNTGSVTSDYFISIEDCSDGIIRVSDRHRSIDPNQHGEYIFQLSTSLNENMNHTCHGVCVCVCVVEVDSGDHPLCCFCSGTL